MSNYLGSPGGDASSLVLNTLLIRTQNQSGTDTTTEFTKTLKSSSVLEAAGVISNSGSGTVVVDGNLDVQGKVGAGKTISQVISTNRDLSLCDTNANGNVGTNPNGASSTNIFMGPTDFYSSITVDRRVNPSDPNDTLGGVLGLYNQYQDPYYDSLGGVHGASTLFQWGHDPAIGNSACVMQLYNYYGPGHYHNRFEIDCTDNYLSSNKAISQTMPLKSLITTPSVLQNSISTTNNIGTITNVNYFTDTLKSGLPQVGQTVTISATPSTLNVTNALILSVTPIAGGGGTRHRITYQFNSSSLSATSTAVQYVYYGPGISASGNEGSIIFNNGPVPLVGQTVTVLAQPASLNVTNAVITAVGTSGTGQYLTFNYPSPTTFGEVTHATVITAISIGPGHVGTNTNYGEQGFFGIHTSLPKAPLDITGDVVIREVTSSRPLFFTQSTPAGDAKVIISDPFVSSPTTPLTTFDVTNQLVLIANRDQPTIPFTQFDCSNGHTTWFDSTGNSILDLASQSAPSQLNFFKVDGETPLFQIDQATNTVTINGALSMPTSSYVLPPVMALHSTAPIEMTSGDPSWLNSLSLNSAAYPDSGSAFVSGHNVNTALGLSVDGGLGVIYCETGEAHLYYVDGNISGTDTTESDTSFQWAIRMFDSAGSGYTLQQGAVDVVANGNWNVNFALPIQTWGGGGTNPNPYIQIVLWWGFTGTLTATSMALNIR